MADFKNELSWSFSRDRIFRECLRQYYYYYYAAWGGWERNASLLSRKAYLFKNMKNLDLWAGDVSHQIIEWVIRGKKQHTSISLSAALAKAEKIFYQGIEQSANQMWRYNIKGSLNLFEHYYENKSLNDLGKEKFEEKIAKSIKRFYDLGILEKLEDAEGEDYLSLEELRSFYYSGVKIYIKIDFAIKRDGLVYLYDWKTGRESYQDRLQLQAYAFYAQKSWGVEYSAIRLYPVYLTQDDFSLKAIANISPQELTDYIDKSLKAMKERLVDVDNNQAVIDNFVPQRQQYRCRHCFFKELCFPPSSL
ncbi:MAG: PD-(D/E)XK nuclease family protein [Candidatus Omnitrophica bacterium]|nr:PD-(D/E)XK nuclease family protein [Candidatus Omnitrophota bacterium]